MYSKFFIFKKKYKKLKSPIFTINYIKRLFVSIKVFLSDKVPNEKDKILSIISFNNKVNYENNIISTGLSPVKNGALYEIWEVENKVINTSFNEINLSANKNFIFGSTIIENDKSYKELGLEIQSKYLDFLHIVRESNMKLIKIWHYIPQLLRKYKNNKTNYSLFCDAREVIYKKYHNNLSYPAATVIGIEGKKLIMYFIAANCETYNALENKRQVSAYDYPQDIFFEKPMFSRAVNFSIEQDQSSKIIISGTASIKGYQSMHPNNIAKQLDESLKNYKIFSDIKNKLNVCRIYVSKEQKSNIKIIEEKLDNYFKKNQYALLYGDICREELLIENEGISDV